MSREILNTVCDKKFFFTGPSDTETADREAKFPITEAVANASAAIINLAPVYKETYAAQAVAAAMTINVATTNAVLGDKLYLKLTYDGTDRIVTWGTGVSPLGATAGATGSASKKQVCVFFYDGTNWQEIVRGALV